MKKLVVLGVTVAIGVLMVGCERKRARRSGKEGESSNAEKSEEAVSFSVGEKTGDTMTITLPGGAKMEMVYVGPDSSMGGDGGDRREAFSRRMMPMEGFWMGKYEVTQAQWEYACRAGSTGDFGGTGAADDVGWHADNSGKETHSVGQKKPNEWGFHDMHGNTWEWCADYFPCAPATNRAGSALGVLRALRGGCWDVDARYCRSAWRAGNDPGYRNRRYGFRLCYSAGRSE